MREFRRYRVEIASGADECVFTVVAPSGKPLYSYTDAATAQEEADALNRFEAAPAARRVELADAGRRPRARPIVRA
jgi:hypothetical protein